MRCLSVDSTSGKMSVSFSKDEDPRDIITDDKETKHITTIISIIDTILNRNKTDISQLDLFGVNLGPGDFTGTRIGITVIKMFSWLSGSRVFGFNALDVTASMLTCIQNRDKKGVFLIAPVLDVRNKELYYSFYRASGQPFSLERITGYKLCDHAVFPESIMATYEGLCLKDENLRAFEVILGGNGISNYPDIYKLLKHILDKNDISNTFSGEKKYSDSGDVDRLLRYFSGKGSKPIKDVYPVYVRDFQVFGK